MARPIKLTDEYIMSVVNEFSDVIKNTRFANGKVSYEKVFRYNGDRKANVVFSPTAYLKMVMLLNNFDSEVAWHGTTSKIGDSTYMINDIIVYPQEVTGATVNTDQEEYTKWLISLDDDVMNSVHMQGHSHVRMTTTPSGVDESHQESILKQVGEDGYYIFMIFNKMLSHNIKIYDMSENILYEDGDIIVSVADDTCDLDKFIEDSNSKVVSKRAAITTTTNSPYVRSGYYDDIPKPSLSEIYGRKKKDKDKSRKKKVGFEYAYPDDIDFDDEIFGYH